jgi:hypothetical protein
LSCCFFAFATTLAVLVAYGRSFAMRILPFGFLHSMPFLTLA